MNKSEEFNEDILTRYINPEKIEKAPSGFTGRVMNCIQMETIPSAARNRFHLNYRVPIISFVITAALIITTIITSSTENDSAVFAILKPLSDLTLPHPKFNFEKLYGITIPGWIIYIMIGIFMLSIFDRVLNFLFHRDRK